MLMELQEVKWITLERVFGNCYLFSVAVAFVVFVDDDFSHFIFIWDWKYSGISTRKWHSCGLLLSAWNLGSHNNSCVCCTHLQRCFCYIWISHGHMKEWTHSYAPSFHIWWISFKVCAMYEFYWSHSVFT